MDGKMFPFLVFFICVNLGFQYTLATIPEITLATDDGDKKCARKYTTCSLSVDGAPVTWHGEKGEPGLPGRNGFVGMPGMAGSKGEKGETGRNGWPGMPGMTGLKGEKGEIGPIGPPGLQGQPGLIGRTGLKGEKGETGLDGRPGKEGPKGNSGLDGPMGLMGLPGPVGPPGIPGMPGVSGCSLPPNSDGRIGDSSDNFGAKDNPAESPCKSAPPDLPSGIYYLGPYSKDMEVYCNMTTLETCIRSSKTTPECNYSFSEEPFWLNTKKVHIKELYNDTSEEQLIWLRARSNYVRQTLKYNCLDSVPYPKHNVSSSVKLWTSNDVVIGPYPSPESPVFYSVPQGTDNCKEGSTEWQSTIIEVQSSNVYRLPIADLWVGDIRKTNQKMSLQSVELCFR